MAASERLAPCRDSLLLATDSHKVTHHLQYPPGTEVVYSYFESRGGKFPETTFFGLQYIIKRWLLGQVVTREKIEEAKEIYDMHLQPGLFNYEGWQYILEQHGGRLPVRIRAVPEGTVLSVGNVLVTVENTDPHCFWLTSHVEAILSQVWYPTTVCSQSRAQKLMLARYLDETADSLQLDSLRSKLHDFGFRGSTSVESAGIGGAAHLVNFNGSSTIAAITLSRNYYGCRMAARCIPSAEHSTITSWMREGEVEVYKHLLRLFPCGNVSVVSDSYNIWNACEKIWGEELREDVKKRGENGGVLYVRPDSGDPATVIVRVLEILGSKFGTVTNSKGYKLLPPYIRVVQGDGISYDTLEGILEEIKLHGWSLDNLTFGSGGGLLQKVHKDTQKCIMGHSCAVIRGRTVNIFKEPITDMGKVSKKGRMTLELDSNDHFVTHTEGTGDPSKDHLVTVFEDGVLLRDDPLEEISARAELPCLRGGRKQS